MKKPRILLADDHPVMLNALCGFLEERMVEVVGTVTDGQALVEAAQRLEPDIIILGYLDAQAEWSRRHSCPTDHCARRAR